MNSNNKQQNRNSQYSPFLYCELFALYLEDSIAKENDTKKYIHFSLSFFIENHEESYLMDFKELIKTISTDSIMLEYSSKVFFEEGKKIDLLNLLILGVYLNELLREHFIVLLKQPTESAIKDLGEICEITFKNSDGKVVTTNNKDLIKSIMQAISEPLKIKGQAMETEMMGKIGKMNKIGNATAKRILQCKFAYYLATFLNVLFPEGEKGHQGKKGIVTRSEQILILRLMTYFGLYDSNNFVKVDNKLRTHSFRKLLEYYYKLRFPSIDSDLSFLTIMPFTIVKYEDWANNKDWFDPNFELTPLTEEDKIYYIKEKLIL